MDAPKGRYRVLEKEGRLVVIDTHTGEPASSPGPHLSAGPIADEPGLADRIGRQILRLAVQEWDEQGRAIIAWEWTEGNKTRRWDARLEPAQQRRLGRALLAFATFPLVVLLATIGGFGMLWFLMPLSFPATLWGVWSIMRLKAQTGGGG